ncbi:McrC family protein [Mycolicibacterium phocaicum]|uniref:McrC family protein n=1 Tax=Mycolicibacterium phocaicum TaxID=319706 RepID=UPI001CFA7BCF|nr:McrC family protein [Mycolicibacterium phocaicum]UCZ63361.1 McrC family protein [Mycolicibacterium phocaicum]
MHQTLELSEYQTICKPSVKPTPADQQLAEKLSSVGEFDARLDVRWLVDGRVEVKASSWVGTVRFSGLEIRVVPKLVGGSLRVLRMIEYASGIRMLSHLPPNQRLLTEGSDLFQLIVLALVQETRVLLRDGLIRDYRPMDDSLTVLRGRLRMRDQFLRRFGSMHQLECQFDEYDGDIPDNQLLAAAFSVAAIRVNDNTLRAETRSLTDVLLSICNPLTRDAEWYTHRIHYGRRNTRYRPAHELALLVLKGLALSDLHSASSQGATAFMLDMNTIFERFVTRLVSDALADSPLTVSAQQSVGAVVVDESTGRTYSTIRPDLIIADDRTGQRVPVDVKYKLYEDKKFSSGDIYQLFTYAYALSEAASKRNAGVLYAATAKVSGPALQIKPMAGVYGAHIRGAGLDVPAILDGLSGEASPTVLSMVRETIQEITATDH